MTTREDKLTPEEAARFTDSKSWEYQCLQSALAGYALGSFLRSDPVAMERYKLHIAIGGRPPKPSKAALVAHVEQQAAQNGWAREQEGR